VPVLPLRDTCSLRLALATLGLRSSPPVARLGAASRLLHLVQLGSIQGSGTEIGNHVARALESLSGEHHHLRQAVTVSRPKVQVHHLGNVAPNLLGVVTRDDHPRGVIPLAGLQSDAHIPLSHPPPSLPLRP